MFDQSMCETVQPSASFGALPTYLDESPTGANGGEMSRCWVCLHDHEEDAPCAARQESAKPDDFFESAEETPALGPIFMATYETDDACCGQGIQPGEDIRADGRGGWIHADDGCERMAR
jgi:hypothetical protein